jgi:PadR family transcriptional regulator, regulatory protein AphA
MLRYALLGILNYSPMNGYELKQFMDNSTSHFWHAKLSQIYTTLKTLEEEGLLVSTIEAQQERPDKRIYTITDAGRGALRAWLEQPLTEIEPAKDTLMLKLFFSAQVSKETILTQLRLQRALYAQVAEQFGALAEITQMPRSPELAKDALLWEATRSLGERLIVVYLGWLDDTIKLVDTQF